MLELFQRILDDQSLAAGKDPSTTDLKKLIEYILKKFFKAVKDNPMLLVEVRLASVLEHRTREAHPQAALRSSSRKLVASSAKCVSEMRIRSRRVTTRGRRRR